MVEGTHDCLDVDYLFADWLHLSLEKTTTPDMKKSRFSALRICFLISAKLVQILERW